MSITEKSIKVDFGMINSFHFMRGIMPICKIMNAGDQRQVR